MKRISRKQLLLFGFQAQSCVFQDFSFSYGITKKVPTFGFKPNLASKIYIIVNLLFTTYINLVPRVSLLPFLRVSQCLGPGKLRVDKSQQNNKKSVIASN